MRCIFSFSCTARVLFCSLAAPVLLEPMREGHEQLLAAALSSRPFGPDDTKTAAIERLLEHGAGTRKCARNVGSTSACRVCASVSAHLKLQRENSTAQQSTRWAAGVKHCRAAFMKQVLPRFSSLGMGKDKKNTACLSVANIYFQPP